MAIKKNIPYKVLKILGLALIALSILNIIGCWVGWTGRGDDVRYVHQPGLVAFGIVTGVLVLLALIAMAVCAFLNQKIEARRHGWTYAALAAIHFVFVLLMFAFVPRKEDYSLPTLFTIFLLAIIGILVYIAFAGKKQFGSFGSRQGGERPIRREDLGSNPTEATVDQVANPENNPDRKPGRDEKTGIVSL